MPHYSKTDLLPTDIKDELTRRILANDFNSYQELSEWLLERGYEISRSSIGKTAKQIRDQHRALFLLREQAKVIARELKDSGGDVQELLTILSYNEAYKVLLEGSYDKEKIGLPQLISSIASLNKSQIYLQEYRQKMEDKAKEAAAKVEQLKTSKGIDDETINWIKQEMLNIVA